MSNLISIISLSLLFILLNLGAYGQLRPDNTISQGTGGTCVGCQIVNPDNAWDNDPTSYTNLQVSSSGLNGYAEVIYGFSSAISDNDDITLNLRFNGTSTFSDFVTEEVFQRLLIELQDNSGNNIKTYDQNATLPVEVVSEEDNIFKIHIINPDANTQRIKIRTGDLSSLSLAGEDLYIFDIIHTSNNYNFVTTQVSDGLEGEVLDKLSCIGCDISDAEFATDSFDPNSDYTDFSIPLSVTLGTAYLYSRYSWNPSTYSGNDYDVYLILESAQALNQGEELSFFTDSNINIAIEYTDATTEIFNAGSGAMIEVEPIYSGSARFYIKIDANNSKIIQEVEVQFGGNLLGPSNLYLYSIFTYSSGANPGFEDNEAIATLAPSKRIDEYTNGESLVTISDLDGDIINASIIEGTLPSGTSINTTTGEITVSDNTLLEEGSNDFTISTVDERGGTSVLPITLVFLPADQEAVYTVNDALPVNDYADDQVLATVTDEDGDIVSATVSSGSLPPGTSLDSDGTISVSDADLLVAGTHNFTVTTTDENGGTTASPLSITINSEDHEAVYTVNEALPVNDYADDQELATVTDEDGDIVSATVSSGSLPPGTSLDSDGTISVSDADLLVAGTYNFTVTTTDENGGTTASPLSITINSEDHEAVYTVNEALPVNDYADDQVLATVADEDGDIVNATVSSGTLPPGTTLALDGTLTVNDASLLEAGIYNLTILTTDENSGSTASVLSITFDQEGSVDQEAVYTINPSKPMNQYVENEVLGIPSDPDGEIISAEVTQGSLPPGIGLTPEGKLIIQDSTLLEAGTYSLAVTTTDILEGSTASNITLILEPMEDNPDTEAIYTVFPARSTDEYQNQDTLAVVIDFDGMIINAVVTNGTMPPGTAIKTDGTIIITDKSNLKEGIYNLTIKTTDEQGGSTHSQITVSIDEEGSTDNKALYVVNPSKPVNQYLNNEILATVSDPDGSIVQTLISQGSLPTGVELAQNGTFKVSDSTLLSSGTFTLSVITTDELEGISANVLQLVFGPKEKNDNEAVYLVYPSKAVDLYDNTDALAHAVDEDGEITSASIISGTLPEGVALAANGEFSVSDATQLKAGSYGLLIKTTDELGGTTTSNLLFTFDPVGSTDAKAVYTVLPANPVNQYRQNELIADVHDPDGEIVQAQVTLGSLPTGVAISANGDITIADSTVLVSGSFSLVVRTTDILEGTTDHSLTLKLLPAGLIDLETVYIISNSLPVNFYNEGDILATAFDEDGEIIEAFITQGTLPSGVSLSSDGKILVYNSEDLEPGSFQVDIVTTDIKGGTTLNVVIIKINDAENTTIRVLPGLSPNGDGKNETWAILGLSRYPNNMVRIYNRWGNLVYEQQGYDNSIHVWDGSSNRGVTIGKRFLPNGTYFYLIDLGDSSKPVTGYVVLKK